MNSSNPHKNNHMEWVLLFSFFFFQVRKLRHGKVK